MIRIAIDMERMQHLLEEQSKKTPSIVKKNPAIAAAISDPKPPTPEELLKMAEGLGDPWRFDQPERSKKSAGPDIVWT